MSLLCKKKLLNELEMFWAITAPPWLLTPGVLIPFLYMPVYFTFPHVIVMDPARIPRRRHRHPHAYLFQQYQHFYTTFTHTGFWSPRQTKKKCTPWHWCMQCVTQDINYFDMIHGIRHNNVGTYHNLCSLRYSTPCYKIPTEGWAMLRMVP